MGNGEYHKALVTLIVAPVHMERGWGEVFKQTHYSLLAANLILKNLTNVIKAI